jgi:hypothetical protein
MADEPRALWDPLWEYVLDDYDVEEEKRQKRRGRKEPEKEDKGVFGFFSEEARDEEYEASPRSKKGSHRNRKKAHQDEREPDESNWGWGGAEKPEKILTEKTSRRHPWRRSKLSARDGNTGYDTDQASKSAWGLTGGRETEKKDPETLKFRILKKENGDKAITKNETIEKNKKGPLKKIFQRPFRKEEPQVNTNKEPLRISHIAREANLKEDSKTTRAVAVADDESRQESRPARSSADQRKAETRTNQSKTDQSKNDESEATFVSLLFDVAEKLDPWMSESDSDSDTRTENTDERTEQTDDKTSDGMTAAGSDNEELPQAASDFTEIRLQHTPAHEPPPDDESAAQQGMASRKSKQLSASSQDIVSFPAFEPSEAAVLQPIALERSRETIKDEVNTGWQFFSSDESNHARVKASGESGWKEKASAGDQFPSDEYFRKSNKILQSAADLGAAEDYEAPKGLKRLVCCGSKKYDEQATEGHGENRGREEISDMLPRTRMISDQQTSIVGKRSDAVNGVLGVPSDRFLKAKGPQSLYAYDYESNQHMDVAYKHFSKQPRAVIECRTHAELPPMESPSGDRAIVQVEVCE